MAALRFEQKVGKLPKHKGGYFFLHVAPETVDELARGKATRIIVRIDDAIDLRCGLNHMGDGGFFVIVATRHMKKLGKLEGDRVAFTIEEDPNPLGVEVPEVLEVLLDQDDEAKATYEALTDGRKRTLIHTIGRIKDVDKQVHTALAFLEEEERKALAKAQRSR